MERGNIERWRNQIWVSTAGFDTHPHIAAFNQPDWAPCPQPIHPRTPTESRPWSPDSEPFITRMRDDEIDYMRYFNDAYESALQEAMWAMVYERHGCNNGVCVVVESLESSITLEELFSKGISSDDRFRH